MLDDRIEAVQKMQEYIEENLYSDITLDSLARASGFSPWYAHRLFSLYLNMTPSAYIRKLRLSKSALRLRDETVKILDVALDVGYDSVDGYQRAFFREFGCNPKEYARCPSPIYLFNPYKIKYAMPRKEEQIMQTRNIFIQVIEKPDRKVIIKRGTTAKDYWNYCSEVGCDVWGLLKSIKSISGEPICCWLPRKYKTENTSEYVQGVEVAKDYDGIIPDGFDVIELPKCKYLMFQGEPFEEKDFGQAIEEVQKAINNYNLSVLGYSLNSDEPRIQLEPIGTRGYIEMIPIK